MAASWSRVSTPSLRGILAAYESLGSAGSIVCITERVGYPQNGIREAVEVIRGQHSALTNLKRRVAHPPEIALVHYTPIVNNNLSSGFGVGQRVKDLTVN